MNPPQSSDASLFSRVVREPLDAVVAPLVRDALIHDALGVAKLSLPPQERTTLRGFVGGALSKVLERALGAELGRSVVEEMLRALTIAPPVSRPPRPNTRIPRPRNFTGSRTSSVPPQASSSVPPPQSGRPSSSVPPPQSGRPSVPPQSGRPSVPPSVRPSVIPPSVRPSVIPPSVRPSIIPPSVPSSRQASTLPPPPRSVQGGSMPRSRPTPVPYGMRRPTPPPGMVDARSAPPRIPDLDSHAPRSGERSRPGSSLPPIPSTTLTRAPLVLVGTMDRAIYETLARSFEDRARVHRVLSAADVVRELDEAGGCRKIVILDAKAPTVRPAALAVLLETIPGVEVVMCRTTIETEEHVLSVSSASANWIIYREIAPLDRVAEACAGLVS